MNPTLERIRTKFIIELESNKGLWQIYRRSTFVDLIVRDFVKFNRTQNPDFLIDIFNNVIKMRMIEKLSRVDLKQDLTTLSKSLDNTDDQLIQLFDETLHTVSVRFDTDLRADNLHNNVLYFRVASSLNLT